MNAILASSNGIPLHNIIQSGQRSQHIRFKIVSCFYYIERKFNRNGHLVPELKAKPMLGW